MYSIQLHRLWMCALDEAHPARFSSRRNYDLRNKTECNASMSISTLLDLGILLQIFKKKNKKKYISNESLETAWNQLNNVSKIIRTFWLASKLVLLVCLTILDSPKGISSVVHPIDDYGTYQRRFVHRPISRKLLLRHQCELDRSREKKKLVSLIRENKNPCNSSTKSGKIRFLT